MQTTIGSDIGQAAEILRHGGLVAIPTETVYGLAGNALDAEAVIGIFEAKQRPRFNPLIMHLPSLEAAEEYVTAIPEVIREIAVKFSPGPISYLLPKARVVPDLLTAGSNKVVIRIPAHPMTMELLQQLDFPLAAPSANPFGYVSPVTARHVMDGLEGRIPYILDGGTCKVGVESTIIGTEGDEIVIYRVGGVSVEEIASVTGREVVLSLLHKRPETPGQLKTHYAPSTPMIVGDVDALIEANKNKKIAVISFTAAYPKVYANKILSPSGNLHEAASSLFSAIREIDRSDAELILAERFPDVGIGRAINDRLGRAGN
jgi:L-threonylcarbamoyladenylate synthase